MGFLEKLYPGFAIVTLTATMTFYGVLCMTLWNNFVCNDFKTVTNSNKYSITNSIIGQFQRDFHCTLSLFYNIYNCTHCKYHSSTKDAMQEVRGHSFVIQMNSATKSFMLKATGD